MSTAKPTDLFRALHEVNSHLKGTHLPKEVSFDEVGATWTTQAGVPLVNVTRDYASGAVLLTQERFYLNPKNKTQGNRWWVPLTWIAASAPNHSLNGPQDWFYDDKTIQLNISAEDWLLFNIYSAGYYRVNYDDQNWSLLAEGLKRSHRVFPTANRVQIFSDAVNLVLAGRLSIDIAFDISEYLLSEEDPVVWMSSGALLYKLLNSQQMSRYSAFTYIKKKYLIHQILTKAYDVASEGKKTGGSSTLLYEVMKERLQGFACNLLVISCYRDQFLEWVPNWIRILL